MKKNLEIVEVMRLRAAEAYAQETLNERLSRGRQLIAMARSTRSTESLRALQAFADELRDLYGKQVELAPIISGCAQLAQGLGVS